MLHLRTLQALQQHRYGNEIDRNRARRETSRAPATVSAVTRDHSKLRVMVAAAVLIVTIALVLSISGLLNNDEKPGIDVIPVDLPTIAKHVPMAPASTDGGTYVGEPSGIVYLE